MRKLLYGLLVCFICVSPTYAKVYTDKTFLMTRSHNDNMAMEYSGWHKQFRMIDDEKWGASIQATGFYQASTNKTDLGKYFGKFNSATGPNMSNPYGGKIQDFIWVKNRPALVDNNPGPLNNELALLLSPKWIVHYLKPTDETVLEPYEELDVMGMFRPKQTSYGIRLDYHQKLDKLAEGLYFKATVPVVHVRNDLGMSYTGRNLTQTLESIGKTATLSNYLSGQFCITGTQDVLTHAKICGSKSTTGIADIEVKLGYNFLYKEHKHVGTYVSLTIPTDRTPDGEWLFDPVLGKAGHWAIGMGLDGAFELWQHGKKSLEFVGSIDYKYVLNETEKRTLGFKYPDDLVVDGYLLAGKRVPMGHYFLGGKFGTSTVFPLANVLTQDVGVEPGSQVEVLADLAMNWGDFTLDIGYNLFAKERECVTVKCWTDYTYAIAKQDYNPADPNVIAQGDSPFSQRDLWCGRWDAAGNDGNVVSGTDTDLTAGNNWIQKKDLDATVAETPVYVTHKIFGGFTYAFNSWDYPLMLGIGGSWEFTQGTNSAIDGYALWLKGGITF